MVISWAYVQGILILAGCYLVAVIGLSLLTGFTGLFSFGHAGFMAIGAYMAAGLTTKLGLPLAVGLIAGGSLALLVSLLIGALTLNLKGDYFCIATLGFGEIVRLILDNFQPLGGARGLVLKPMDPTVLFVTVYVVVVLVLIATVFIIHSRHGRNFVAIREEELASAVIGIDTFRYKMISLAISAFYAGVAGGLFAHNIGYIQPYLFQILLSQQLTIMVIFGGLGSITGSVVAAFVLTALPEVLRPVEKWRLVVYGIAVIFIMISRPQGLMGGKEISDLWKKKSKAPIQGEVQS